MARRKKLTRSTQIVDRDEVREQLQKIFQKVNDGFTNQVDRSDDILDYWDIFNCKLGSKQFYSGNSRIFVPLVHNAVEARKTRFMNQLFPQAGRSVSVTTEDGDIPHAEMALLELYAKRAELRTKVIPALLVAGDVEGDYNLCVTWGSKTRHTVSRETKPIVVGGIEHPDLGEIEKITEDTDEDAGPEVDIIPDPDFLVLPETAETIDEAIDVGGSVTAICRWSKERVQQAIDTGEIAEKEGGEYVAEMIVLQSRVDADGQTRDVPKKLNDEAGIRARGKVAMIFRTFTKIEVDGEKRLVLAYYGGDNKVLGCKLCPYWNDKPDYIWRPVKKLPGVGKGMSPIKPCADMQYFANDAINEGADSATYSMLPIVMTDPQKNPRVGSMVMDLMAVWETSPKDTQLVQFPQLYQHAFNIVSAAQSFINQTLGVSPAMMPQSTGKPGVKRNQAEVAMEQQVELLNTDESCVVVESLLSEMLVRFAEYDAQFRDNEMTVRSIGEIGVKAQMVTVPPAQMGKRWQYEWRGLAAKTTVQQVQQQISALNVLKEMSQDPAVAQAGFRVNPVPLMKTVAENAFGPNLAPQIFVSVKDELSIDQDIENVMLLQGFEVPVSPMDNDAEHLQKLMPALQQSGGDPHGVLRLHGMAHQRQMQMKAMQQAAAQQQQQMAGQPQAGPGPRPGAAVVAPRAAAQQPAGRIAPDQMRGGIVQMPRRAG